MHLGFPPPDPSAPSSNMISFTIRIHYKTPWSTSTAPASITETTPKSTEIWNSSDLDRLLLIIWALVFVGLFVTSVLTGVRRMRSEINTDHDQEEEEGEEGRSGAHEYYLQTKDGRRYMSFRGAETGDKHGCYSDEGEWQSASRQCVAEVALASAKRSRDGPTERDAQVELDEQRMTESERRLEGMHWHGINQLNTSWSWMA